MIDHWAKAEIIELVDKGLLRGTSAGKFSPNQKTNRAMLFTILYRLNGEEAETTGKLWYEDGLQYVVKQGISDGTNPLSLITREQLITMLHRYAGKPKGNADLTSFVDEASIQGYAKEAMLWAVEKGILVGNPDKKLQPQKNATRAEVVVILSRFMKVNGK
ncbi:MAG: S-layer homology domain-containing protein [Eubacteriales bacterium]|nr:S-layer homology domain-containing protein [Eubacteriales bacterium]